LCARTQGPLADYHQKLSDALDAMELNEYPLYEYNPYAPSISEQQLDEAEASGVSNLLTFYCLFVWLIVYFTLFICILFFLLFIIFGFVIVPTHAFADILAAVHT
jgi:hypothetical protein